MATNALRKGTFFGAPLVWALGLACMTALIVWFAKAYLPQSDINGRVVDALCSPAVFLLSPIFPAGPHTAQGILHWGYYVLFTNCLVYAILWYGCILFVNYLRHKR